MKHAAAPAVITVGAFFYLAMGSQSCESLVSISEQYGCPYVNCCMKKHNTFPGEQPEMPGQGNKPEIQRPDDPNEPKVPGEDPDNIPEELPGGPEPDEDLPLNPGSLS